jgi:ABC-type spermidine/putrescine transport system permease subunit I
MLLVNPFLLLIIAPFWVAFYFVMAGLYDILTRRGLPEQRIASPFRLLSMAAFSVWIVAGRLIEMCALCTLDSTSWMTRQRADKPTSKQ